MLFHPLPQNKSLVLFKGLLYLPGLLFLKVFFNLTCSLNLPSAPHLQINLLTLSRLQSAAVTCRLLYTFFRWIPTGNSHLSSSSFNSQKLFHLLLFCRWWLKVVILHLYKTFQNIFNIVWTNSEIKHSQSGNSTVQTFLRSTERSSSTSQN